MSTHNIGFGRELMDLECHHSLPSAGLTSLSPLLQAWDKIGSLRLAIKSSKYLHPPTVTIIYYNVICTYLNCFGTASVRINSKGLSTELMILM